MYKGVNIINNEGLGFKLINSMSLGEFVFLAGFNQKTTMEDLIIKGKYRVPLRYLRGKTLEHSRSYVTEAESKGMTCGATWPHCQAARPLWAHLSASFVCRSPTAFDDASRPLLKSV